VLTIMAFNVQSQLGVRVKDAAALRAWTLRLTKSIDKPTTSTASSDTVNQNEFYILMTHQSKVTGLSSSYQVMFSNKCTQHKSM